VEPCGCKLLHGLSTGSLTAMLAPAAVAFGSLPPRLVPPLHLSKDFSGRANVVVGERMCIGLPAGSFVATVVGVLGVGVRLRYRLNPCKKVLIVRATAAASSPDGGAGGGMLSERQAQALREGDVGDQGGERFFPTTKSQTVEATGVELPSDPPIRIGHGYDIHKYLPRESTKEWKPYNPQPTVIGGVTFEEFPLGVVANSDGDVIYHCVTDAILGALGLPDIGQFFPDNIPKWRGANSKEFFNEAVRLMELRKYQICNVDVTVIAEKPRLAARKPEMKANVVRLGHTIPARVNIKARTHEKLDSVGECRAIECHAVVVLERGS